ncbi:YhjD/YihY/BrkB family envelope integrity protein [Actinomadura opuntiae]|uniref:YhjD/YihY/BrkB family envelope integrity protein n=1 Tax=Actinomadura sp. OS1-43 TaxID=604315 RepID=UPI00255A8B4E|nr:YhjD/YihY/BrkB family envelope integrity protein [Actinomadura sp. OS1-43]MDL4814025.1 YhjD/YihY/BrkB family envelope integrity protein [Actinomadura sp. OS1-43]
MTAVDFFGNSFQLAALAILCFFPFLIVITTAAGQDAATVIIRWLGLDTPAARAVEDLFEAAPAAGSFTVLGACLLVLGAMAVAGTLQSWYQRVFDVRSRGLRDLLAQSSWLAGLLGYAAVQAVLGRASGALGGPILQGMTGLTLATLFWWWTMKVMLGKAADWGSLFPSALATGVCWVGLGVFSSRFFSDEIVANKQSYGSIGVVMVIMSWLVATGVVVHLGSVVGSLYCERRETRSGPRRHD